MAGKRVDPRGVDLHPNFPQWPVSWNVGWHFWLHLTPRNGQPADYAIDLLSRYLDCRHNLILLENPHLQAPHVAAQRKVQQWSRLQDQKGHPRKLQDTG